MLPFATSVILCYSLATADQVPILVTLSKKPMDLEHTSPIMPSRLQCSGIMLTLKISGIQSVLKLWSLSQA